MAGIKEEIPRSGKKIDLAVFEPLMRLTLDRPWLEGLSVELEELWRLCNNDTERSLVRDLILHFTHVDSRLFRSLGDKTASHICDYWNLSSSNTLIVATSDNSDADGSQVFIQSLKNKFTDFDEWKETNFCNRIGDSLNKLNDFQNIILLDDFIGTGNTIKRRVDWYLEKLKKKDLVENINIYVVAIGGMNFSKEKLDELGVKYFCSIWLEKGIADQYQGSELNDAISAMEALEAKLNPKIRKNVLPSFGYRRSEALFAIEPFNIPNNVFPIFWWAEDKNGKKRKRLFKRLV